MGDSRGRGMERDSSRFKENKAIHTLIRCHLQLNFLVNIVLSPLLYLACE